MTRLATIDLFCGVGGLTHGLLQEGIEVVAGIDADGSCQFAYEENNAKAQFLERDVAKLTAADLDALFPRNAIRILAGCAPCQPFSRYTRRASPDGKWKLLTKFSELATSLKPEIVTMENVMQLQEHAVFETFVRRLEAAGYSVTYFVARCPDYGIPQRRKRLVLFASQFGPIELIPPTHPDHAGTTLRDAIGDLPTLQAGETSTLDPLHRCRGLSPKNLKRLQATATGGSWRDWPEELQLECHKRQTGKSYRSVYGRLRWDQPGPVVTTQFIGIGNGRFGHPEQDRALSLREGALIQTFPKSYRFIDPSSNHVSMVAISRQIGNAVPVRLGRVVGRSIKRHCQLFV